ncbi:hypothetical protein BASA81_015608 [Batrachochytrium salamandrivorans]|nr:hypothetical protein BASA81_015608 [Batrachochytrium salamandrivorans]
MMFWESLGVLGLGRVVSLPWSEESLGELEEMDLVFWDGDEVLGYRPDASKSRKLLVTTQWDLLAVTKAVRENMGQEMYLKLIRQTEPATSVNETQAKLAYFTRLAEGINAEGNGTSLKLLVEGKEKKLPFTWIHVWMILLSALVVMVFGSMSLMDEVTLKPSLRFTGPVKQLAYWTNIPIKFGLVHFVLYLVEYLVVQNNLLTYSHVGQRMTTLWFQLVQHKRDGQHLQMHLETLMQVCDLWSVTLGNCSLWLRVMLLGMVLGVFVQNAVTSLAYHSLVEQLLGLGLFLCKYLLFDLQPRWGGLVNYHLGALIMENKWRVVGGLVVVLGLC